MYNKQEIMARANTLKAKRNIEQGEALHRSWNASKLAPTNAQRIAEAKAAAGIPEDVEIRTWKGWKDAGYEVIHGSKSVLKVVLEYATKGDGATYTASFFTKDQVQAIA